MSPIEIAINDLEFRSNSDIQTRKMRKSASLRKSLTEIRKSFESKTTPTKKSAEEDGEASKSFSEALDRNLSAFKARQAEAIQQSLRIAETLKSMQEEANRNSLEKLRTQIEEIQAAAEPAKALLALNYDSELFTQAAKVVKIADEKVDKRKKCLESLRLSEVADFDDVDITVANLRRFASALEPEVQRIEQQRLKAEEDAKKAEEEEQRRKAEEEAKKAKEEEEKRLELERRKQQEQIQVPAAASIVQKDLLPIGSERNLNRYQALANLKAECQALSQQVDKVFKSDCLKAVNTPVNAISVVSADHLKDNLVKLQLLLRGQTVEVADRPFAASNPSQVVYIKNVLAKKFVSQGLDVVNSKPEYAFAYAVAIAALWHEFPDFGQLFLAHLFDACPYLLPLNLIDQRIEGEDETDFFRRIGYRVIDGNKETQDKFIGRMSGAAILYVAVSLAWLPKANEDNDHPHGLGNVWSWIAATVNVKPIEDVTASLLRVVIETAGSELFENYGIQFKKLLLFIKEEYLQRIRSLNPNSWSGPIERLEALLDKAIAEGNIKKPEKQLSQGFI